MRILGLRPVAAGNIKGIMASIALQFAAGLCGEDGSGREKGHFVR